MKSEYRAMIQMLGNLDPATNLAVDGVVLHLRNGETWSAIDVTVDKVLVYARNSTKGGSILCVPIDEICGVSIKIMPGACEREKIDETFPAIAKYGEK